MRAEKSMLLLVVGGASLFFFLGGVSLVSENVFFDVCGWEVEFDGWVIVYFVKCALSKRKKNEANDVDTRFDSADRLKKASLAAKVVC